MGVLFLTQLVLLTLLSRAGHLRLRLYFAVASIVGWLGLAGYIELVYLAH